ncbi:MAG: GGDEF domain-containing protein [Burkholderiales bacterium]|nr:GGDEF domain-containing protein [Burkholderiales bacterium]
MAVSLGKFDRDGGVPSNEGTLEGLPLRQEKFEAHRRAALLYVSSGIATCLLLCFGLLAATNGRSALAAFLIAHGLFSIGLMLVLKFTEKISLVNVGFVCAVMTLFAYLLASGGVDNTGPLWAYPLAAATIFLQGARRGLFLLGIMFCIALTIFSVQWPNVITATYSSSFKLRFLVTFAALAFFAAMHEFARARFQEKLLRMSVQLDQLSHSDPLTGLPNRRYMCERLEAENQRYLRHGRAFSILYADVDYFKRVNDHCGHQAGDAVLQAISEVLRSGVRQADEVCRWGGEEFLILLPETEEAQAIEVAEKLRLAVASLNLNHDDAPLPMTMSIGVHAIDGPDQVDAFIHCADQKLYRAKANGRNCVVATLTDVAIKNEMSGNALSFALAI